jgi:hypothetical protein
MRLEGLLSCSLELSCIPVLLEFWPLPHLLCCETKILFTFLICDTHVPCACHF